jgi:hypothetical protein
MRKSVTHRHLRLTATVIGAVAALAAPVAVATSASASSPAGTPSASRPAGWANLDCAAQQPAGAQKAQVLHPSATQKLAHGGTGYFFCQGGRETEVAERRRASPRARPAPASSPSTATRPSRRAERPSRPGRRRSRTGPRLPPSRPSRSRISGPSPIRTGPDTWPAPRPALRSTPSRPPSPSPRTTRRRPGARPATSCRG